MTNSFFFNATATTEIYTLSLHDALPISAAEVNHVSIAALRFDEVSVTCALKWRIGPMARTQKISVRSEEQRLNSSHSSISYAVFCLKKKKIMKQQQQYVYNSLL